MWYDLDYFTAKAICLKEVNVKKQKGKIIV